MSGSESINGKEYSFLTIVAIILLIFLIAGLITFNYFDFVVSTPTIILYSILELSVFVIIIMVIRMFMIIQKRVEDELIMAEIQSQLKIQYQ